MKYNSSGNVDVRRKEQERNLVWEDGMICEKEWKSDEMLYSSFCLKCVGILHKIKSSGFEKQSKGGKK